MTRPHTLIIYAHPSPGSFNHAVLQAVTDSLDRKSRPYDVIDLYADGFDPRYTPEELALFHEGGTLDTLVTRYQDLLDTATRLIIIAPVWWSGAPSILNGFVEKVMKQGWAYKITVRGVRGKLGHIREVLYLSTSTSPTRHLRRRCGNAIEKVFLGTTLRQLGIRRRRWVNFGKVGKGGKRRHNKHLKRVARLARP